MDTHSAIAQTVVSQYSFDDYKKECLGRATQEGLTPDVAEELCTCTIAKFQSRYSLEEFRALIQQSKTNKTDAETLTSVGEACFEEILYED